jgi:hypothetical protein
MTTNNEPMAEHDDTDRVIPIGALMAGLAWCAAGGAVIGAAIDGLVGGLVGFFAAPIAGTAIAAYLTRPR